jgi:hypothetical protein
VLDLHRRRQHEIGVARGVGEDVVHDDGEEIRPRESLADLRLVRCARNRVRGVDEQRLDRRIGEVEQPLAEAGHAERSRDPRAQVVAHQRGPVHAEEAPGVVRRAAARIAPVAGHAGQACDRPHRHTAAAVALQADPEADARRPRMGDATAEGDDVVDRESGDARDALGRVLENALAKHVPAERVLRDELAVLRALGEHHVHQPERERRVGAGYGREVPVGRGRGPRADRIDRYDERALVACHLDRAPEMGVGGQRVRGPQHDELGVPQGLRVHPDLVVAERVPGAEAAGDRADRHGMAGRAEGVPEPLPAEPLNEAEVAGADVRPDRLGAELGDDLAEARGDLVGRVVPGDALEAPGAFRADAPHRVQQTVRRARVVEVAVELVAQRAAGERMRAVAFEADGHPVLHGHDPAARVRAVERARAADVTEAGRIGHAAPSGRAR